MHELSLNQGKRNEIPSMWEKAKCASSLKNLKFIMPRGIQDLSKRDFIKKGKIHQAQKGASASRQERSLESASKWLKIIKLRNTRREKCPQKFIQSRDESQKNKKIKK